jgi:hypothetical protein
VTWFPFHAPGLQLIIGLSPYETAEKSYYGKASDGEKERQKAVKET